MTTVSTLNNRIAKLRIKPKHLSRRRVMANLTACGLDAEKAMATIDDCPGLMMLEAVKQTIEQEGSDVARSLYPEVASYIDGVSMLAMGATND